jgi:hypothetical protein
MEARPTNPHGQMEALSEAEWFPHRAAAELTGIGRESHRRFKIAREERD